jgi:hypothetical protein
VFTARTAAEDAVAGLRSEGIAGEDLGLAIHRATDLAFEDDVEHDESVAIGEGVLVGVPIGALAGMGLVAVALPGIGTVAVGGLLAAGGAAGGVFGAFMGGLLGLVKADPELSRREAWERHRLAPGEILVVARSHEQPDVVRSVLTRHGGRFVEEPTVH